MNAIMDSCAVYEPGLTCLHEFFERQAACTPEKTAVVFADQTLSYRELNERANQLAWYLRACGVGPEILVGIYLERSLFMVIGLLAVLKAGGAYVPLDPTYPQERLTYMTHDAHLAVLLSQEALREKLLMDTKEKALVISLDHDWPIIAQESTSNLKRSTISMNLSHVIYTSGSTGQPKGVAIQHANAVAFVSWAMSVFSLDELAGTLASTSICFDLSLFELFVPLSCGGTVLLIEDMLHFATAPFVDRVTLINTVPSVLSEMLQIHPLPSSVRCINVAGEPFPASLAQRLYQQETIQHVYNLYGPSESTTYSTVALIERGDSLTPSLGQPIANSQVYIVDRQMKLVSREMVGEVYIGGAGVTRGYLHRPELTAQRFVPNPFGYQPGTVLYKTGDLARYRTDGAIEFLGRDDQQVKVRGFRVELGEIEEALRQHPDVREVVLIAQNDKIGQKQLVAYVIAQPASELTANDLRNTLRQKLPPYMIPSRFILLDVFPRLPNSKIDYPKLAALDIMAEHNRTVTSPHTAVEERLHGIWHEVLALQDVGIHDPFLELGGHSLQALRILLRVQETFQVAMPYPVFLQLPTIAEQAAYILEHREAVPLPQSKPTIQQHANRRDPFPLSFGQQQLWIMDQVGSQSLAYNIPVVFHLRGQLDLSVFRRCIQEIVNRHEILRTIILSDTNGYPIQVIKPTLQIDLPLIDIRILSASIRAQEMRHLTIQAAQTPFDLARGPLLYGYLVLLADDEYAFLLTMHHIVADDWSLAIYQQELAQLYQDFTHGQTSSLLTLPIQYADFALWQHEWLHSTTAERQFAYWQQRLADLPEATKLPADRHYPAQPTFQGAREVSVLPTILVQQLESLSKREGVTLYTLLLCAFKIFLYRYTDLGDIIVGSVSAGRQSPGTTHLPGFFVNMLPLRTQLSHDLTFLDALQRVRETVLEATTHQDLPFGQLVERLQIKRDLGSTPLFELTFSLQHSLKPIHIGTQLFMEMCENDPAQVQFAVEVLFVERQGELSCSFNYANELFEATTIRRMMKNFQCLLESIIAFPQQRLPRLPLLADIEREQVLFAWNATQRSIPAPYCLYERFEQQAARTPEAIAVIFADQTLSYRELNERANQLAWYLRACGVGPEILVGIYLERSLFMVIGLLAVLKAGGAYVPLDPTYPQERLTYMVHDACLTICLTQEVLLPTIPRISGQVFSLDTAWGRISAESRHNLEHVAHKDNLAYVIYTSGSTGRPKGVMISHIALSNHMRWMQESFPLVAADRVLQKTPVSFDASVWEFYAPLLVGAQLVLARPGGHADSGYLVQAIIDYQITRLQLVPSMLHILLQEPRIQSCTSLTHVFCGGETLSVQLQKNFFEHLSAELHNLYGPTEATIDATYWNCVRAEDQLLVPIGRPLANTEIYLLDKCLEPVPVGVSGELYISGVALARGYFQRSDLTAEHFIPNPFASQHGARLYKTGDITRYLPDGKLEYIGRTDQQVKIRGFRIELGEIETILQEVSGLANAVVIAREDEVGEKRLVAYIASGSSLTSSTLRAVLQERLPTYMLPSAFVFLDSLPLKPNGKVDRMSLPRPDTYETTSEGKQVSFSPLEEVLLNLWCEALKLKHVGVNDHFLDLGGHSLLAMQIASRIRQIFRLEIPLQTFFQTPTVAKLAEYITSIGKKSQIDVMKIAQLMIQINILSDAEVKALLARPEDLLP